jgi:hypothetical protein
MSENNEEMRVTLNFHGMETEHDSIFYKKQLTLKQLQFANHYIKHKNYHTAYAYAYPEQKNHDITDVITNKTVLNYIIARLRAQETTIDEVFDNTMELLEIQALDRTEPKAARAAQKLIHDTKCRLREIVAKLELKKEIYHGAIVEKQQQPTIIQIMPYQKPEDTTEASKKE